MLEATVLALTAAVLHAGWNLAVKVRADRLAFLGVQFLIGGLIGMVALLVLGDVGEVAWRWAFLSGVVHIPYFLLLALSYRYGDFSLVYPLARGGGALVAALGGALLLADHLPAAAWVAIAIVAGGLASLAAPARGPAVRTALGLAAVIGTYTLVDAHGARISHAASYGFATLAADALTAALVLTFSRRWVVAGHVARSAPLAVLRRGPRRGRGLHPRPGRRPPRPGRLRHRAARVVGGDRRLRRVAAAARAARRSASRLLERGAPRPGPPDRDRLSACPPGLAASCTDNGHESPRDTIGGRPRAAGAPQRGPTHCRAKRVGASRSAAEDGDEESVRGAEGEAAVALVRRGRPAPGGSGCARPRSRWRTPPCRGARPGPGRARPGGRRHPTWPPGWPPTPGGSSA